ncbi:hypothetical protein [Streptomyces tsukubensis]|uniref:Uncharacterized protein n=1 Tax=Streptomyces tsukubensis TaxID=83656 RepID=A0A1V4A3D3_9ACTN|nr:hypothetical protein [Streptomyces tsukubensis]OON74166.1 hypothetical protein B1H18_25530 [Streptomyces tsukubensis]QFR95314.1 hypothetical protein GBW32_22655 [Streptomyces tsukubensis]
MPRHEFHPGKLVAGLFSVLTGLVYAGDAGGAWEAPWFVAFPLMGFGLICAATAAVVGLAVRRGSRRRGRKGVPAPSDVRDT